MKRSVILKIVLVFAMFKLPEELFKKLTNLD